MKVMSPTRRSLLALPLAAAASPRARAAVVPRPAPGLAFRLANGSAIDLSSYRGKVVVLEFLLTTCPHCQRCSSIMQKMQTEFGPKGLQCLGVAINDMSHMLIEEYSKKLGLTFPVGYSTHNVAVEFMQHPIMQTFYMPQLAFIDRKGVIRFQHGGNDPFFQNEEANMRKEIEQLIAEGAPPAPAKKTAPKKSS
jgi:peroxiredoxin